MDSKKAKWCFHSFMLIMPFLIEHIAYPLFMKIQPQWLAGALFFILYTYLFYGLAIVVHCKWRKRIGSPITFRFSSSNLKGIIIALIVGVAFRHLTFFIIGHSQIPMIVTESVGYIKNAPLPWMGIGGYVLQFTYYMFEFTLVTCIVDCAQTTSEKLGLSKRIPWGGIFLGVTWGLGHIITKNFAVGIHSFALSIIIGSIYLYLKRKPVNAWVSVFSAYLL